MPHTTKKSPKRPPKKRRKPRQEAIRAAPRSSFVSGDSVQPYAEHSCPSCHDLLQMDWVEATQHASLRPHICWADDADCGPLGDGLVQEVAASAQCPSCGADVQLYREQGTQRLLRASCCDERPPYPGGMPWSRSSAEAALETLQRPHEPGAATDLLLDHLRSARVTCEKALSSHPKASIAKPLVTALFALVAAQAEPTITVQLYAKILVALHECEEQLAVLAGGQHYRDSFYAALETAHSALEAMEALCKIARAGGRGRQTPTGPGRLGGRQRGAYGPRRKR